MPPARADYPTGTELQRTVTAEFPIVRVRLDGHAIGRAIALGLLAAALLLPRSAWAGATDEDSLTTLIARMDGYFVGHAVDGITMDSRYDINPPEAIRQSVVCQLLGYAELDRMQPSERTRAIIARDADFLISRYDEIRSHTPFDGMLGYAMLSAFEATGEPRFQSAAAQVVDELLTIPTSQCILNGGLMVAMATAKDARLNGRQESADKTHAILAQLVIYQNADGSFPHWCGGSEDIHYTGWMAHELVHLKRLTGDTLIAPMLARMGSFMEARVGEDGRSRYEEPCTDYPGCTHSYYSRATGCWYDYDTRGWTVEPGYQLLLFDHVKSPVYARVMSFMLSLEHGGTLPDLYAYWPPPSDPEYPWTVADTSVANMSIVFWSLATIASGRAGEPPPPPGPPEAEPGHAFNRMIPHPLRLAVSGMGHAAIELAIPPGAAGTCALDIQDVAGRIVRRFQVPIARAQGHTLTWDGRDAAGARVRAGVYFVRLRGAQGSTAGRVVLWR